MKLARALNLDPSEAHCLPALELIYEEQEAGPRLGFGYPPHRVDPTPDILALGTYQHPTSGNELLGGINLHYLTNQQRDRLRQALPQIMQAGNLYGRYWAGRRLIPDVFNNFYRTYRTDYIRNAQPNVLYPKYNVAKTATNWLKDKIANLFRNKQQRQQAAQPQFPADLTDLPQRLNTIARTGGRRPLPAVEPDTPQLQAARQAFQRLKALQRQQERQQLAAQAAQELGADPADIQLRQANQDIKSAPQDQNLEQPQQAAQQELVQPTPKPPDPAEAQQALERDREANRQELAGPGVDAPMEAIEYYSPRLRRRVLEFVHIPSLSP